MHAPPEPCRASRTGRQASSRFRGFATTVLVLVLSACATAPPTTETEGPSPLLREIGARMPGEYVSVREENRPVQTLSIGRREDDDSRSLGLSMIQAGADGENVRRYGLKLTPSGLENRLDGEFALLGARGQVRRSCPMDFHASGQAIIGETDPAACRFGDGERSVGLLKEIAFDGRSITIGDRLVDPESGEALGRDRIIRFLPVRDYEGWLGVREGEEWRVARDFALRTGGNAEPLDAADMSLGVSIALGYYRMERGADEALLRLSVTDRRSGVIVAESWAEPGTSTIGIALPDLQVGLRLAD